MMLAGSGIFNKYNSVGFCRTVLLSGNTEIDKMNEEQYLADKQKDLDFLEEMKKRLLLAPFDSTNYEFILEMINDWIDELNNANEIKRPAIRIRILNVEDWQGLYVNGILVDEGHSINLKQAIEKLIPEVDLKSVWYDDIDPMLDKFGNHCPRNYSDLWDDGHEE